MKKRAAVFTLILFSTMSMVRGQSDTLTWEERSATVRARKIKEGISSICRIPMQRIPFKQDSTGSWMIQKFKGHLTIPVDNYISVEKCCEEQCFDKNPMTTGHPKKNVLVIICDSAATVMAIAGGTVSAVVRFKGTEAVIIRHGEFLSVYYELHDILVKEGQWVVERQKIGAVLPSENGSLLRFELWKGLNKLDPTEWIELE